MTKAQLISDFEALMIPDSPSTMVSGSDTVTGTKSKQQQTREFYDYGTAEAYRFTWFGVVDDFDDLPEAGDLVAVDGDNYRVMSTGKDDLDAIARIEIGDKNA